MSNPIEVQAALVELEQRLGGGDRETVREARGWIRRLSLNMAHIASVADEARGMEG